MVVDTNRRSHTGGGIDRLRGGPAPGATGLLATPREPQEIADAIVTILRDFGKAERMGKAGLERAERLFADRTYAGEVQEVYDSVLEQVSRRGL